MDANPSKDFVLGVALTLVFKLWWGRGLRRKAKLKLAGGGLGLVSGARLVVEGLRDRER